MGRFSAALKDAKSATDLDPSFSKGFYRQGQAHEGLEQYDEAAEAYKRAIRTTGASSRLAAKKREMMLQTAVKQVSPQVKQILLTEFSVKVSVVNMEGAVVELGTMQLSQHIRAVKTKLAALTGLDPDSQHLYIISDRIPGDSSAGDNINDGSTSGPAIR
jgi:tetratricopeptide (TPR) repeat protein